MNNKIKLLFLFCAIVVCHSLFALNVFSAEEVSRSVDVSKSSKTIILKDSDGDGFLDSDDPHPEVAEIYIVSDKNNNGIVDSFEANIENSEEDKIIEDIEDVEN